MRQPARQVRRRCAVCSTRLSQAVDQAHTRSRYSTGIQEVEKGPGKSETHCSLFRMWLLFCAVSVFISGPLFPTLISVCIGFRAWGKPYTPDCSRQNNPRDQGEEKGEQNQAEPGRTRTRTDLLLELTVLYVSLSGAIELQYG